MTSDPPSDLAAVRSRLKELIEGCVQTGEIKLASGRTTDFYFDGRTVSLNPEGAVLMARLFLEELRRQPNVTAIGGPTSGADPIVSSIGVLAHLEGIDLQLFYIRKETKEHGLEKRIEGPPLSDGAEVFLVDDVLTTGGSLLKAYRALREEANVEVRGALLLVDREEGGAERLKDEGLEVYPLFRRSDFSILKK